MTGSLLAPLTAQAPLFERRPVQSDPAALARLVQFAELPADSLVLDAGCGPGLVSAPLLAAGHRVVGVDLSREMIERARKRCAAYWREPGFSRFRSFEPQVAKSWDRLMQAYRGTSCTTSSIPRRFWRGRLSC